MFLGDGPGAGKSVDQYIEEHKVIMFSKSYCPFCEQSKQLLKSKGVEYFALELDKIPGGGALQNALKAKKILSTLIQRKLVPHLTKHCKLPSSVLIAMQNPAGHCRSKPCWSLQVKRFLAGYSFKQFNHSIQTQCWPLA